mgnify:CR=1 FL=1|jgi:hypothetical protein
MTVVNEGAAAIASLIATNYQVIAIGDGADSTSASQTGLNNFTFQKTGQTPTVVGSTLIYNVDFTGAQIPSSGVSELGIFANGTTNGNGTLLSRVTFTNTGVVASGDTVSFTIRIEVDN